MQVSYATAVQGTLAGDTDVGDGLKLQAQLAARLADKLRERGQTVRDLRKFLQHVDKLRIGVITKGEFHTVLFNGIHYDLVELTQQQLRLLGLLP